MDERRKHKRNPPKHKKKKKSNNFKKDMNVDVYACFRDETKAYNSVKH